MILIYFRKKKTLKDNLNIETFFWDMRRDREKKANLLMPEREQNTKDGKDMGDMAPI